MSDVKVNQNVRLAEMISRLPVHLPAVDNEERSNFDKLFAETGINGGRNKLSLLKNVDPDVIEESFIINNLNEQVIHATKFVSAIKRFAGSLPLYYQHRLGKSTHIQVRMLGAVLNWDAVGANDLLDKMQQNIKNITVENAIPFVCVMYRPLLQLLFLGEVNFNQILDKTFEDVKDKVNVPLTALQRVMDEAKIEWSWHLKHTVKELFPLLMRIISSYCVPMQEFLDDNIQRILAFLFLQKTDIILPGEFTPIDENSPLDEPPRTSAYAAAQRQIEAQTLMGLKFLDTLFPQAGWKEIENFVDLFPYYQPLFKFSEGVALLSPQNPMQVVVILLQIIEDLLPGCSKIKFTDTDSNAPDKLSVNEIERMISDWYLIRMNIFDKEYAYSLTDYVNRVYSQPNFKTTPIAIKTISGIVKMQKTEFFPHLKYEEGMIVNDASAFGVQPAYKKIARLSRYFGWLSDNIASASRNGGVAMQNDVIGMKNTWEPFDFSIENPCSKRLSAVLKKRAEGGANNANLILAISQILYVLDWWLTSPKSPAYAQRLHELYRTDAAGEPVFSVPLRTDVKTILATV